MYVDSELWWKFFYYYFQGQIQKIQKGVAGTLAHLPAIYMLFISENFIKIPVIQNFKEKGVATALLAHP